LERRGYRVIERNVRRAESEIDLVAGAAGTPDATLVFVEVKLRRSGRAVEALSAAKRERLCRLAEGYAAEHPGLPAVLRIDLLAIDLAAGGEPSIEHIEGAVEG
jgi:putative endonuclease